MLRLSANAIKTGRITSRTVRPLTEIGSRLVGGHCLGGSNQLRFYNIYFFTSLSSELKVSAFCHVLEACPACPACF